MKYTYLKRWGIAAFCDSWHPGLEPPPQRLQGSASLRGQGEANKSIGWEVPPQQQDGESPP